MYAIDFEFDGQRVSDFGCIMTSFTGMQNGTVPSGASITFSSAKSLASDRYDLFSSSYDSPFTASFGICKNPCEGDDNPYMTLQEVSMLQRWLCRRTKYCKFKLLSDGFEDIYWNGWFSSQEELLGGNIIGLQLTFTADAPYAYMEDITLRFENEAGSNFIVDSVSHEEGYIIPDMVITLKQGGDFSLTNNRDNRTMQIENCSNGEKISIAGKYLLIESSDSGHDLSQDFNFIFPRIFNLYDDIRNIFTSNLACDIEITYTPAMKVGF